jgi:flap endonuclease-1
MGVDLGDLAVKNTVQMKSLSGKTIAIDAYNVLYQFLSSIRQEDGTPLMDLQGNVTAHLSGLFYRTAKLVGNGIKPVYVFDGKASRLKEKTQKKRREAKKEAEKKWKQALKEEKLDEAKKFAMRTSRLTRDMAEESKELLDAMGIPYVQAPGEGEAQAAVMASEKIVYATASQDFDALLFGSPILIRNISITGRRKVPRQNRHIMIEPEEIRLEETLKELGIDRKKLIMMGILIGTDFNQGVHRVGPKTALKIAGKVENLDEMKEYVKEKFNHEFEADPEEIMDIFMNPRHEKVEEEPKWGKADRDRINELLVEKHDFSEERLEKGIDTLEKIMKEKNSQSRLDDWF